MRVPGTAGQRHEIGVGDVLVAVGVGEPFGFADQVHAEDRRLAALEIDAPSASAAAMLKFSRMPSADATVIPPEVGGGMPQTQ